MAYGKDAWIHKAKMAAASKATRNTLIGVIVLIVAYLVATNIYG